MKFLNIAKALTRRLPHISRVLSDMGPGSGVDTLPVPKDFDPPEQLEPLNPQDVEDVDKAREHDL